MGYEECKKFNEIVAECMSLYLKFNDNECPIKEFDVGIGVDGKFIKLIEELCDEKVLISSALKLKETVFGVIFITKNNRRMLLLTEACEEGLKVDIYDGGVLIRPDEGWFPT